MLIKLDNDTAATIEKEARRQGKTAEKLIEDMIKANSQRQQGRVKDTPFATIYSVDDSQPRLDIRDLALEDLAAENEARRMMIAKMRKGRHPVMAELSESEARAKYLEKLKRKH